MRKRAIASAVAFTLAMSCMLVPVQAKETKSVDVNTLVAPKEAVYGYYVDVYRKNESTNLTPESNPSIGVLSRFLDIYTPGDAWNNGVVKNTKVHIENLLNTIKITNSRTKEMEVAAYLDDRRNQSYSAISGLGGYADAFIQGTGAGTTIQNEIPSDATTVKYEDKGNANGNWAEVNSTYGAMVSLVNTIRSNGASTSSAKKYYKYMRPFRWTNLVQVEDILTPCINADPSNDGGFPSGHTNAAYLSAYALAYAAPERFQELITRASELGNNRIVAGMHSCLDVIGGRVMATAVAAAALNDPANSEIKAKAYEAARTLLAQKPSGTDAYADYAANKKKNLERLTYGMTQIGDTTKPMTVPKGAEVLLETRLPYLDATQRRVVLYTTGLESGYPVLDDAEGWGRLNLFEAANGYGSFVTDVVVTMDASKGGFNAADEWKNDIDGVGSLTKAGTGKLTLSGNNTFTGGVAVNGGTVTAASSTAFGNGNVANNSAVTETVKGVVSVKGNYKQADKSNLSLTVSSAADVFKITGSASFDGKLTIDFQSGYVPSGKVKVVSYNKGSLKQKFDTVVLTGLPSSAKKEVIYGTDGIYVVDKSSVKPPVIKKTQVITVSQASYQKTYGDKAFNLNAKTNASGVKLSYKSDNTSVVTISNTGTVTIKGSGKATITISAPSTSTYKAAQKTVTITVKQKKH